MTAISFCIGNSWQFNRGLKFMVFGNDSRRQTWSSTFEDCQCLNYHLSLGIWRVFSIPGGNSNGRASASNGAGGELGFVRRCRTTRESDQISPATYGNVSEEWTVRPSGRQMPVNLVVRGRHISPATRSLLKVATERHSCKYAF